MKRRSASIAAFLFALVQAAQASDVPKLADVAGRYAITPSSRVGFTVGQVGGGGIKGVFGEFAGTFDLRADDLAHSAVSFELKPSSVSTGQSRIDDFLRSGAVFDTAHFDRIAFRSSRVEQTGQDTARLIGTLTAKGHSGTESFNVTLANRQGSHIAFNVSGRIYRSRYGMDVGTPIYSNVVQFEMMIDGQRR